MIAFIIVAFAAGWAWSSWRSTPRSLARLLDKYVIMVALPAVIVSTMARADLAPGLIVPVASAWVVMGMCAALVLLAARVARWSAQVTGALLCVAVLGNTSFMGLGMVEGLLGADHLVAAIAYDQLGTFLALSLWVPVVVRRCAHTADDTTPLWRGLLVFPPFVALLVAMAVRVTSLPDVAFDAMDLVAPTVAPVALFTVGLRFRLRLPAAAVAPALTGLSIKMLVVPVLVAAVVLGMGNGDELTWSTTLLQSAAPPMVSAGIVAIAGGLDEDVASFMVGAGTLAGFVWVPMVSLLV